MKKFFALLSAVVIAVTASAFEQPALAPAQTQASPVQLEIYSQNYCTAAFTWYYYGDLYFAIAVFRINEASENELVAGIVVTPDECDNITEQDGVKFPNTEENVYKYYFSTFWLLNASESSIQKGAAWDSSVFEQGAGTANPYLALKEGNYSFVIYECDGHQMTSGQVFKQFTLTDIKVSDLNAAVAADNQSATLTWTQPTLPADARLYLSVLSGETVAFDNYSGSPVAASPLTLDVEEGKSYSVTAQVLDANNAALGSQVTYDFTVGTNDYIPTQLRADVTGGDQVTFAWDVTAQADKYELVIYKGVETLTSLTVNGTSKLVVMPEDGTYTWTLQGFNLGTTGAFYPATPVLEGPQFTTQAEDIPEDAEVLTPWNLEAAYYPVDATDPDYREGKYIWFIRIANGENGLAYPLASFIVYSNNQYAISGVYSSELNNIYMGEGFTIMDKDGNTNRPAATSAELRLSFEGYDDETAKQGYRYAYYSGQFKMTCTDGKTYVGKFINLLCDSYNADYLFDLDSKKHVGMWDEDPDYDPMGIEDLVAPDATKATKVLHQGALYILMPNGTIYNAAGQKVK